MNTMEEATFNPEGPVGCLDVLIVLYGLTLIVLSAVFPFTFIITGSRSNETVYLQVLGIYLAVGSVLFLIYVCVRIYVYKRTGSGAPVPELTKGRSDALPQSGPLVYVNGGVNFFLRIGLIVFGFGTLVQQSFRVMAFVEDKSFLKCYGISFLILEVIRIIETVLQTYFLFKHHNIVLCFNYCLIKFGLAHVFVFNTSHWLTTVTFEAWESLQQMGSRLSIDGHDETNFTTLSTYEHLGCRYRGPRVMADRARGYLYPAVIAYCMLSSAVLLRLLLTTTDKPPPSVQYNVRQLAPATVSDHNNTYRTSSGLLWGLLVFFLTLTSVSVFYYYHNKVRVPVLIRDIQGLIYMATTLVISLLGLGALLPAFYLVKRLDVVPAEPTHQLNHILLLFTVSGHYFLLAFMIFPMASTDYLRDARILGVHIKVMGCLFVLVDFAQSTLQVVFIFYAKHRRCDANTPRIVENAGRSFVTFLFFCNLSSWFVNSMELKESYNSPYFIGFYGALAWVVILSLFLPMSIFFRFHSGVCLSEVWLRSYQKQRTLQQFV